MLWSLGYLQTILGIMVFTSELTAVPRKSSQTLLPPVNNAPPPTTKPPPPLQKNIWTIIARSPLFFY